MASLALCIFTCVIASSASSFDIPPENIRPPWFYVNQKLTKCLLDCVDAEECQNTDDIIDTIKSFPEGCGSCLANTCSDAGSPFLYECINYALEMPCADKCTSMENITAQFAICHQCRSQCIDDDLKLKILETSKCLKKCHHYYECQNEPSAFCNHKISKTCGLRGLNCYFYARAEHSDVCSPTGDLDDFKNTVKCKRCYRKKCSTTLTGGQNIYFAEHKPLVHY